MSYNVFVLIIMGQEFSYFPDISCYGKLVMLLQNVLDRPIHRRKLLLAQGARAPPNFSNLGSGLAEPPIFWHEKPKILRIFSLSFNTLTRQNGLGVFSFSIIIKHTRHQGRRQPQARGLSPTKMWLSPPNKFRDSPEWEGLRATAVVQPVFRITDVWPYLRPKNP